LKKRDRFDCLLITGPKNGTGSIVCYSLRDSASSRARPRGRTEESMPSRAAVHFVNPYCLTRKNGTDSIVC
jgi:hypothetical protein